MTRTIMTLSCAVLLHVCTNVPAQASPPSVVANTVSNLWISQDFSGLNSYITNLYVISSNYVPAILASAFHDCIYLGRLSQATNKIARLQDCVRNRPQDFTVAFKDLLDELRSETTREVELHARMGTTPGSLETHASPQAVRSAWGTTLLPQINILFYAPATNAP
jgi:hypothetical protein